MYVKWTSNLITQESEITLELALKNTLMGYFQQWTTPASSLFLTFSLYTTHESPSAILIEQDVPGPSFWTQSNGLPGIA